MTGHGTFDADAFLAGEPLNVDPVLVAILAENRAIQRSHRPHHTFAPSSDPLSFLPIIAACNLGALGRHPDSYRLYADKFKQTVRRRYGSMEGYLRQRLGWQDTADTKARATDGEYFVAEGEPGRDLKVSLNEWPYAIESNVASVP